MAKKSESLKAAVPRPNLSEAVAAKTEGEAAAFVRKQAEFLRANDDGLKPSEAESLAREQICYHAAIYHHTELSRIEELYKGNHAVYRSPKEEQEEEAGEKSPPSPRPSHPTPSGVAPAVATAPGGTIEITQ